ncbi:hypothetical protein GY45DRAFT_372675 [Cubamyces sp. BRFM 1775]|nr:hypothetical protein GY45DRAFT_372675 [Cubamyces sp. BRFM 1775]
MLRILSMQLRSPTPPRMPAVAGIRCLGTRGLHNPNHAQLRRTAHQPEELTHGKTQLEAVSGELPSTPVGPPTGLGGYGGGGGNGVRDAVLTTIVGVIVREYSPSLCYGFMNEVLSCKLFGTSHSLHEVRRPQHASRRT